MTQSLDPLRRDAKTLLRGFSAGDAGARSRVASVMPVPETLRHADALHVIAREAGFPSWPVLKDSAARMGYDRAERLQRLKRALYDGPAERILTLLDADPTLGEGEFALHVALYHRDRVAAMLADTPDLATRQFGPRKPLCHLAFSRMIQARPELAPDCLAIAHMLVAHGADVNETWDAADDPTAFSALYGAVGWTGNMTLARWLLQQGANPNDGESLYHAAELGHTEGLAMLLEHSATPDGTNALLRAMDFDNVAAVRLLLQHGASPDAYVGRDGDQSTGYTALHHAALRQCGEEMAALLLDHGAATQTVHDGLTAYAAARIYGNAALAHAMEARGLDQPLTQTETLLAHAAEGRDTNGARIDLTSAPTAVTGLIGALLHGPGALDHITRLVAIGVPFDAPRGDGLPPVHVAGWEGLAEETGYLLSLGLDLTQRNAYGGTLLGAILHGADHCSARAERDHPGCLQHALEAGLTFPRHYIRATARADMKAVLEGWARAHPSAIE